MFFGEEVVPVEVTLRKKTTLVEEDEEPARFDARKLRELRPVFSPDGTITAGNASGISDGAAAVLIEDKITPRALTAAGKPCLPRDEAIMKVRAAVQASANWLTNSTS